MTTRVAIWCAVSSKRQATEDKTSLGDQEALGRAFAERESGRVAAVLTVPGHTRDVVLWNEAEAAMDAYRRLREMCERKAFDVLWVLDPDRIGRDPALSNQVVSLTLKAGASIYIHSGQYLVTDDATASRYMFAIQSTRAGEDQRRRVRYQSRGMRARALRGLAAGRWPFGYRPVYIDGRCVGGEFDDNISAVQKMTNLYVSGVGLRAIADELAAGPWRPPRGDVWHHETVRYLMRNDFYAGVVVYADVRSDPADAQFPALWDAATYRAVIRERQRRKRGGNRPISALSGCVYCLRCLKLFDEAVPMTCVTAKRGWRFFLCTTHRQKHRTGVPCHPNRIHEDAIFAALDEYLESEESLVAPSPHPTRERLAERMAEAEARAEATQAKLVRLHLAVSSGELRGDTRSAEEALLDELRGWEARVDRLAALVAALPDEAERKRARAAFAALSPPLAELAPDALRLLFRQARFRVWVEAGEVVRATVG